MQSIPRPERRADVFDLTLYNNWDSFICDYDFLHVVRLSLLDQNLTLSGAQRVLAEWEAAVNRSLRSPVRLIGRNEPIFAFFFLHKIRSRRTPTGFHFEWTGLVASPNHSGQRKRLARVLVRKSSQLLREVSSSGEALVVDADEKVLEEFVYRLDDLSGRGRAFLDCKLPRSKPITREPFRAGYPHLRARVA